MSDSLQERCARAAYEAAMTMSGDGLTMRGDGLPYEPWETVPHRWQLIYRVQARAILDLLDAAAFLDEVRRQVARGALCPMCSTGMTRQTVGMVCQLCGTDYARPEQTSKAALAEALAVRAECDALAIENARLREGVR